MKHISVFLISFVFLTGCTAHMMETQGEHMQLIGKRPAKGGVIRYLNGGFSSWAKRRRADAEKQMRTFCDGGYTITAEGPRSKFGADMPIAKSSALEMDEYTYVRFVCEKQPH